MEHANESLGARVFRSLLAAIALLVIGLIGASTATAAVTEAPELTLTPENPNTDSATTRFEYTKGDGETSTAPVLRFYCRQYRTDTPPASPTTGWAPCGTTNSTPPAWERNITTNGSHTFEVAARETTNINSQGPAATYVWTQNIPAPTIAPIITQQPDPETTAVTAFFAFTADPSEKGIVTGFDCRVDSTAEEGWSSCNGGATAVARGDGTHTFEVRARNAFGVGPASAPVTWTSDYEYPSPSVPVSDLASGSWVGTSEGAQAGGGSNKPLNVAGDLNGDGEDDLVVPSNGPYESYVDILFGSSRPWTGERDLGSQKPAEGFRLKVESVQGLTTAQPIGDHNGDGISDLVLRYNDFFGFPPNKYTIIYGGIDPADLPQCGDVPARCLNLPDLEADQGYHLTVTGNEGQLNIGGTDFDGDGLGDMYFTSGQGMVFVKGKGRSGTVSLDDLPADEVFRANQTGIGIDLYKVGDLDGDGKQDVFIQAPDLGANSVIYGRDFDSDDIDLGATLDPQDGFRIYSSALSNAFATNIGDQNGDGRADLIITMLRQIGAGAEEDLNPTVLFTPERGSGEDLVTGDSLIPGTGYVIGRGDENFAYLGGGNPAANLGDVNNDGVNDFLVSAEELPSDEGRSDQGGAYVIFGQRSVQGDRLDLGPELTPDRGLLIRGDERNRLLGENYTSLGDIDGDGLPEFTLGSALAEVNGMNQAGRINMVSARSFMNQVKTSNAAGIDNDSAVLNAGVSTNNRDTEVHFEFGTTTEYGETTSVQEFEASNSGDVASVAIDGLEKNTTYHYRAVARNELGLVRYGDDRTFTTTNTTLPSNCDTDNSLPGCPGWDPCAADDIKPGCPGYDHCAVKPADCNNGGPTKARLAVITISKKIAVKRGKRGTVQVAVINTGGKVARGVKVCVRAPKRLVSVKRCTKVGSLGAGASRTVKIKVKAKRKRGKAVLRLTANGNNVSPKKAKARVVVR